MDDMQSRFINALRTQPKMESPLDLSLPCPYPGHAGRMFLDIDQLYNHASYEHASDIASLEPSQAREELRTASLELRYGYANNYVARKVK
jgi:hypothetical protein